MVEDLCFKHFSFFWMNFGEKQTVLSPKINTSRSSPKAEYNFRKGSDILGFGKAFFQLPMNEG